VEILFAQLSFSYLYVKDMGYMGKEQADTCIPHRVEYCTVVTLHISYVQLTRTVGGLCGISDHGDRVFQLLGSRYVALFLLLHGELDI